MIRVAAIVVAGLLLVSPALAAQVIPKSVEYSNDTIESGGQLQACIITVAIVSPPAPEIVNFQLLAIGARLAFKVTAGDINWATGAMVAKRIATAHFSTAQFNHPAAFKKTVTPEGQLLGVLVVPDLVPRFLFAFSDGRYSIQFQRIDVPDERVYYIEDRPSEAVWQKFASCGKSMLRQ